MTGFDSATGVSTIVGDLRRTPAEEFIPDVSPKTLEGLKFNACLPDALARRVLQARMSDVRAIRHVLEEPLCDIF